MANYCQKLKATPKHTLKTHKTKPGVGRGVYVWGVGGGEGGKGGVKIKKLTEWTKAYNSLFHLSALGYFAC